MTAPDLSAYRAVHLALRGGADLLAATAEAIDPMHHARVAAFRRYWDGYATEVHTHHGIEDDVVFPAVVERVPVAGALIGRTDDEHQQLDAVGERCDRAVAALVQGSRSDDLAPAFAELADLMRRHLDLEDDDVLPLIERHFTAEEYASLEAEANKRLRLSEALFTIPFVGHFLSDDQRGEILGTAPLPFRIVHRLTRRGHAKLVRTLAGEAAVARTVGAVA